MWLSSCPAWSLLAALSLATIVESGKVHRITIDRRQKNSATLHQSNEPQTSEILCPKRCTFINSNGSRICQRVNIAKTKNLFLILMRNIDTTFTTNQPRGLSINSYDFGYRIATKLTTHLTSMPRSCDLN